MAINLFKTKNKNGLKNKFSGILNFPQLDILRKLVPKEEISALEINDGSLKLLYLKYIDKKIKIISGNEIDLDHGLIENGKIKNSDELAKIIKNLFKNSGPNPITSPYVIVSIPEKNNFNFTLTMPAIARETINETIASNITNLLPRPISNYYIDWQELTQTKTFEKFEVLIAAAKKTTIDEYKSTIEKAGLNLIALETPSISIGRSLNLPSETTNFIIISKLDGITETIYKTNELIFSRFVPWLEILPEEKINIEDFPDEVTFKNGVAKEIKKMSDFYSALSEADIKKLTIILCGDKYNFNKIAKELSEQTNLNIQSSTTVFEKLKNEFPFSDPSWQTAIGASLRTLIPREEDTVISFLPIGTEEIYTRQKLNSFLTALNKFVVFSSILTITALSGFLIYFNFELYNTNKKLSSISHINLPAGILSLETQAENFNKSLKNIIEIEAQIKNPATKLNDLINLIPVGITINRIAITADDKSPISITGNAPTLDTLMTLKQNLTQSPKFKDIKIPISALTKKENIDFNINVLYTQIK